MDKSMKETITQQKAADKTAHESQTLYHSTVEQLPAGFFRKDAAGRYILVNPCFCRLRGQEASELLGKTAAEVASRKPVSAVSGRDQKDIEYLKLGADHHEEIMRSGQTIELEESYVTKDGGGQFFHVVKTPVIDDDGKVVGSQGILIDVSDYRRAQTELKRERDLLRALMGKSDDCIYFKDRESRFVRCSANFAKLFSVQSSEELIGRSDADFFAAAHAQAAFEDEQKIIQTGIPVIGKMEKETWPDGHVTWALTSKWPLLNDQNETIGTFGISKDITVIKEAEAKLEQMHKQLLDASLRAGMAEIATSVLHNVGNVLNSVNVSSSLIADTVRNSKVANMAKAVALIQAHENDVGDFLTNDPKGKQLIGYLANLAKHLAEEQAEILRESSSLVGNVVHIKEIVAMQQNYAKSSGVVEWVKVPELVEDAIRMNSGAMNRHNVDLTREFEAVPDISVEKHKVLQILINVLRNAKYACDDSGRSEKKITVRVTGREGWVQIAIIDNGIGIPPENLTRIFNHGFTTRKEGHGFGVHSGANAAREMGGSLTAVSEGTGHGATFILELPVQKQKS
jgi:PAS domain S-box-containing protein